MITSLKLNGTEITYLDKETFENPTLSVRGGIPILFPNAGEINDPKFPGLQRHGFARSSSAWTGEEYSNGFKETLVSNVETIKQFPFDFKLTIEGILEEGGTCTLKQKVENLETEKDLPLSMGLHPYFKVPNEEKKNIRFNFEGGKFIDEHASQWMNGETVIIDNPKLKDPKAVLEIVIPTLGTLIMDVSAEYKKIWIWSEPGKDFICIEPAMRGIGGLVNDPEMIGPGEIITASVTFSLTR